MTAMEQDKPTVEGLMALADQLRAYADRLAQPSAPDIFDPQFVAGYKAGHADGRKRAALASAPAALSDEQIDKILSTPIPGGSQARDWFLPHELPKGLANVRNVVRALLAASHKR